MIEILNRALATGLYVKLLQKGVGEVWCMGARGRAKKKRRGERFGGVKDTGNVTVEGE